MWQLMILSCCVFCIVSQDLVEAQKDDRNEFPLLWSSVLSDLDKSYHVLYQLEMSHSDEMMTVEEWGAYDRHLFRTDLIAGNKRTTYLLNGATREIHRYKPFTCTYLAEHDNDLETFAMLFFGYPWAKEQNGNNSSGDQEEQLMAYGLGPLWLRARSDGASINYRDEQSGDNYKERVFEVQMKANQAKDQVSAFKLVFYFPFGEQQFVDSIDWLDVAGESQFHGSVEDPSVVARLKVLQVDYETPEDLIFRLPVGYGCSRRPDLDHAQVGDLRQLDVGLVLLHRGLPNQIKLDVVFSRPLDQLLHSWTSERYSIRWLRHSRGRVDNLERTESYYVTLTQRRDLQGGPMRRIKRIWWAPDSLMGESVVYEIDQTTGSCKVSVRDVRDQLMLGSLSESHQMVLSAEQISFLFFDNVDYHLIDEGKLTSDLNGSPTGQFRDRYYEKRIQGFRLTTDGAISWEGPVSLVKRISANSLNGLTRGFAGSDGKVPLEKLTLARDYQLQLTIFFYTQDYKQLEYKIVIDLLANHGVSYNYVHQQLDISACLSGVGGVGGGPASLLMDDQETGSEAIQKVIIRYPLESVELAKRLSEEKQQSIKTALYVNLFETTKNQLITTTPLQINDIQLHFDLFQLQVELTLIDLPLTQLFEPHANQALEARDSSQYASKMSLMETCAASANDCAQHCEHYQCRRFAYETATRTCQVDLTTGSSDELVKQVDRPGSHLWTYFERRGPASTSGGDGARPHLSARSLVEQLEQLVEEAASGSDDDKTGSWNPLVVTLNMMPKLSLLTKNRINSMLVLTPSSISHQLESMKEYVRDEEALEGDKRVVRLASGELKLEFARIMRDRQLKSALLIGEPLERVTFEECQAHCEINDCRSFSYCARDELCQVTQAHNDKILALMTSPASSSLECSIYSLDYLSKFELYGRAMKPHEVQATLGDSTPRFCANVCMEQEKFSCQGFYFCDPPTHDAANSCYLMSKHVASLTRQQRELHFSSQINETGSDVSEKQQQLCSYYSRSYLAQFDKYRGRKLKLPEVRASGDSITMLSSADVNDCARRCTQLNCLAFDTCPSQATTSGGSKKRSAGRHRCQLLMSGVSKQQLVREPRCSTFVLSDRSQFRAAGGRLELTGDNNQQVEERPDEEASVNEGQENQVIDEEQERQAEHDPEEKQINRAEELRKRLVAWHESVKSLGTDGHFMARVFSFALGTCAGIALIVAYNEAYARGWFERARASTSNWRRFG